MVGRAAIHRAGIASPPERDTGDVRATEIVARDATATQSLVAREDAVRRAARRLGEKLARRVLGYPDPSDR